MERRNEHVAMSAGDRTSTAVSLTVTLTCAVAVAVLGIVLYPLQIDTSMGSFEARDLPMATMNDAFKQAEVVFVKLEQGQLGEVPSTTTPGASRTTQVDWVPKCFSRGRSGLPWSGSPIGGGR